MSHQQQSRIRLAFEIDRYDILIDFACERCFCSDKPCIVMKDSSSRLKCSKCVRANKACVNMSWVSLNRIRKDLFSKIAKNEAVLAIVITRLLRNKKMLKKANAKAKRKTQCLLFEMKKLNVAESFNCFVANALIEASSVIWSLLAMLNDFSNVNEISE
jgi:hypothetical protein